MLRLSWMGRGWFFVGLLWLGVSGGAAAQDCRISPGDPNPTEVGFFVTPGDALSVALSGALAFVAGGASGLRIIDVSSPASPVEVGFLDTPGDAHSVAVSGMLAFVADGSSGLRVIDVSTPASPVEVGFLDTPGDARGVAVSGLLALVADGSSGLRVIDVSTPTSPVAVGFFDTSGSAEGVAFSGTLALVVDGLLGLRVIDLSSPTSPVEVGFLDTPGYARGVAISGPFALMADDSSGLRVIDVSTPASPVEVGSFATTGSAFDVAASGALAFVADDSAGLRVIDLSSPSSPAELVFLNTPGDARGVAVSGTLALVAAGSSGLRVVSLPCTLDPAPVAHFSFNETGDAPGNQGSDRRPLKTRDDDGDVFDFHSGDAEGVSGTLGDRSFANTGPSDHGDSASSGTNGFRADQLDNAAVDALGAVTISGWFKTETTASLVAKTPRLVNNHDNGGGTSGDGFNLQFFTGSDGDLKLEVDDDTGGGVNTTGAPYADKLKWVFFAVSYDGSQATDNVHFYRGYRNDAEAAGGLGSSSVALVGTASLDRGPVDDESVDLHVGNRPANDRPFDGWLDEIRIDSFALATDDAQRTLEGYRLDALRAKDVWRIELADSATVATSVQDQNAATVSVTELSGVTYEPTADRFWAVSDEDGRLLEIDASFQPDGSFASVSATSAVTLDDVEDFEGIAVTNATRDSVFLADEGNTAVEEYLLGSGSLNMSVAVPSVFPNNVRPNLSVEALSLRPDGAKMLVGVEQALTVDGPDGSSTTVSTLSRWQQYSVDGDTVLDEIQCAYPVEPVHGANVGSTGSGLSDILLLPNGLVLSLERSEADGEFLTRIFVTELAGATDVSQGALGSGLVGHTFLPPTKRLIYSDDRLGKVEGLALGPRLGADSYAVLAVEDDNNNNVVHAFRLRTVPEPAAGLVLLAGLVGLRTLNAVRARQRRRRSDTRPPKAGSVRLLGAVEPRLSQWTTDL